MALSFDRPWVLFLLPTLALALLLVAWVKKTRNVLGPALRYGLFTLLILAAAGPRPFRPKIEVLPRQVIVLDGSASVDPASLAAIQAALSTSGLTSDEAVVVQFGQEPRVVGNWAEAWPEAEGGTVGTHIARALDFAGQMTGRSESIVLVSDGLATEGDTLGAASRLAAAGVRVDVWALPAVAVGQDVALEGILLPPSLWSGEPFSVTVQLLARVDTPATLEVTRDGAALASLSLELTAGENLVTLSTGAEAEGLTAFEARVTAPNDGRPQNDFAAAVVRVQPPPAVLIVADQPANGQRLRDALTGQGIAARMTDPANLPADTVALEAYQVLVLMDVPAPTLSLEQQAALEAFVYAQGHGLIFTGGPSAYSLGGYDNTLLEQMLPVALQPPERAERAPASLLLIIDRSGSMTGSKLDLTKEAAMRAVEILQPSDRIGVLVFDDLWEWRVPLTTLGDGAQLRSVLDTIGTLTSRGGTDLLTPLEVGVNEMAALAEGNKHVVVLSDGISSSGTPDEFRQIAESARAANVTISTIAVGDNADTELMANIAEWGLGRFHVATTPESIPRLVLAESRAVNSQSVQAGSVQPNIVQPHPLVNQFSPADFPPLEAYVALSDRPATTADVVLASPLDDPLLAAWQYGLGRVVAWTSDVGGVWTPAWAEWPELGRFWAQAVRYALPDPKQGAVLAEANTVGDQVTVTVLGAAADGRAITLASAELALAAPDGALFTVVLPQIAPGEYQATFTAPGAGAYRGLVTLQKAGERWETPLGLAVGYTPEYDPRWSDGTATLRQVAALTGGQQVSGLRVAAAAASADEEQSEAGLWLVLAALLLWPVEIAIRRRWMPWK